MNIQHKSEREWYASLLRKELCASLLCYVSSDDVTLTRKEFLLMVRDRISDDLAAADRVEASIAKGGKDA